MDERPAVLSSRRVFEGRVFDVRIDEIRYPGGPDSRIDVVEHGGSFAIIATPEPGHVVLVRQYRHAVGRWLWELPAGTAEEGEEPLAGAARELREETGYTAARLHLMGSYYMTPGFCDEIMHFVHAQDLAPGEQALDEDELIEVQIFTLAQARRRVELGEIADAKTILALLWLESNQVKS